MFDVVSTEIELRGCREYCVDIMGVTYRRMENRW